MKKILSLVMAVCILTLSLGFTTMTYAADEEKVYALNDFGNGMGTVTFSKYNNTLADSAACYIYNEDSIGYSYKNNGALAMKAAGSGAEIYSKISFGEAYTPGNSLVVEYKLKFDNVYGTCPVLFQAMNNNTAVGNNIDIDKTDNVMYVRGYKNGTRTNITKWNWGTDWVHFMVISSDGVTGDVYINGTKIDTVELNITSAINAIRLRQKVWATGRDMYIDEIRITSKDAMKLDEASVNSGANVEGSFVLDFNNIVDSATLSNIKLMQGETEIEAALYSLSVDALDKTRVVVTLDDSLPDGSYRVSYSELADISGQKAEGYFGINKDDSNAVMTPVVYTKKRWDNGLDDEKIIYNISTDGTSAKEFIQSYDQNYSGGSIGAVRISATGTRNEASMYINFDTPFSPQKDGTLVVEYKMKAAFLSHMHLAKLSGKNGGSNMVLEIMTFDNAKLNGIAFTAADYQDRWIQVMYIIKPDGSYNIYLDGALWTSGTNADYLNFDSINQVQLWERVWTGEGVMKYTDYDDVAVKKFQRLHVENTYTLANETIVDFSHVLATNAASAITVLKNGTEEVSVPISIPSADKTCIKLDTTSLAPGSYTVKYQNLTDITGTKLNGTVTFEKASGTPEYVEGVTVDGSNVFVDLSADARFLGKTLVVAAYNGNALADVKSVNLSKLSNEVTFDVQFNKVKAMVIDNFGTMLPLTVASGK